MYMYVRVHVYACVCVMLRFLGTKMFYVYTLSLVVMIIIGYSENKDISSTSYGNGRFK